MTKSLAANGVTLPGLRLILQAVGRTPSAKKIGAEKACVAATDRGFINVPHNFAYSGIVDNPMLARRAV